MRTLLLGCCLAIVSFTVLADDQKADAVDEIISAYGDKCPQTLNKITKPALDSLSSFQQLLASHKNSDKCFPPDDPVLGRLEQKYNDLRDSHSDLFTLENQLKAAQTKLEYLLTSLKAEESKAEPDQDRVQDLQNQIIDTQSSISSQTDQLNEMKVNYSKVNTLANDFVKDVELFRNGALSNLPGQNEDECAMPKFRFASSLISNAVSMASNFVGPELGLALRGGAVLLETVGKTINDAIWNKRIQNVEDTRKILAISCVSEVLANQYCEMQDKTLLLTDLVKDRETDRYVSNAQKLISKVYVLSDLGFETRDILALGDSVSSQELFGFMSSVNKRKIVDLLSNIDGELINLDQLTKNPWKIYSYNVLKEKTNILKKLFSESANPEWDDQQLKSFCEGSSDDGDNKTLSERDPVSKKVSAILLCAQKVLETPKEVSGPDIPFVVDILEFLNLKVANDFNNVNRDINEERDAAVYSSLRQFLSFIGVSADVSKSSLDEINFSLQSVVDISRSHLNGFYSYQKGSMKDVLKRLNKDKSRIDPDGTLKRDLCVRLLPFLNGDKLDARIIETCSDVKLNSLHSSVAPIKWGDYFKKTSFGKYGQNKTEQERVCRLRNFLKESKIADQGLEL